MVGAKNSGGTWNNKASSKLMRYHLLKTTPTTLSNAISPTARSPFGNKNWKQHVEPRLIYSIFDDGAKYGGGTWGKKTHGRMLPDGVYNKTVNSKL
jgi:hypothetical protein